MKHYKILLLIFGIMLSSTLSTAQTKVKCTNCKNGINTWIETVSCTNCKSWAESYRNIKGCDVCKNNKVITLRKQGKCSVCKGTSWTLPYRPAPLTKEQQILKKLKDLNLSPREHIGYFRLNFQYSALDVLKYRMNYDWSYNNLWVILTKMMTNEIDKSAYKEKVYALLDYYDLMYANSAKSDGWSDPILYYPSPGEVMLIKSQLDKLNSDPDYSPNFFGSSISASDLFKIY